VPSDTEALVCNVVGWFFGQQWEGQVTELARPDQEHAGLVKTPPAVERIYQVGDELLSIEHTLIESFEGQTFDDRLFVDVMEPVQRALTGRLPLPGSFWISVPPGAFSGLKPQKYSKVQAAIEVWVLKHAPSLAIPGDDDEAPHRIEAVPPGLTFVVNLSRTPSSHGKVRIARMVDDKTLEPSRV
jgi:hypothetical protein